MTLTHKARLSAAQWQQEKGRREAGLRRFGPAAFAHAKAASIYGQLGLKHQERKAWVDSASAAAKRAAQLEDLPDFDA